ncbi:MAG: hypothetical protein ACRDSL_24735 [Pseudonocardiaceae bacterium]
MVNAAGDLDVVDWPRLCSIPRHDEIGDNDRFLSWLAPLDYAVTHGLPFFADVVVLRVLARAEGIPTFGTVSDTTPTRTPELFTQADNTVGSMFDADKMSLKIRHIYSGTVIDHRGFYRGAA